MNKALKYKIVVWFIIGFLLIFLPSAVTTPSQIQTKSIVLGIGIDKSDSEMLEVSAQIIIPQQSTNYSPKNLIASAEGNSLIDAIFNIEAEIGQRLGLAHCYVIILGDEICSENIPEILDFFIRSNIMGNNSSLVHTSGKAKKLLETSAQLSASDVNNLQNITKYNRKNNIAADTSFIDLFNEYLSPAPFSLVASISVDESESSSSESSSEGSSGDSSSSSSSATNSPSSTVLKNDGSAVVFKKGKKLLTLNKDQVIKFNWLETKTQRGLLTIEHFTNNILNDVNITLKQISKSINFNAKIVNNTPILKLNIALETTLDVIENPEGDLYTIHYNYFDNAFRNAVQNKVKQDIADALSISKINNFDIMNIYNIFNTSNHQEWKKFLSTLENPENYMERVEIEVNTSIVDRK